ncbi:hypothetical protein [Algoriphagus sp.]|uniref:hypothetical protein n=1 Tax=Algoriphagus sp. TaxID=1872435 RepID=UPI002726CD41|nr:hypothetical protein [Algoriphagus sp.]MDO8968023.1 hypothetical protein [Algoriphagus sp.]MDP3199095.1 hypothetical protein [Algoriphagus sp.]
MRFSFLSLVLIVILLTGCGPKLTPKDFGYYFKEKEQEEIMAKIISYIYITPKGVIKSQRMLPENRPFYMKEVPNFEMVRFFKDAEGRYLFYLVRPARNVNNHKRGVAGVFTLDDKGEIDYFEEVFVTKMIPEVDVKNFGNVIFDDFVSGKGKIEMNPLREDFIEFPSLMSVYDFEEKEWTYKEPVSLE